MICCAAALLAAAAFVQALERVSIGIMDGLPVLSNASACITTAQRIVKDVRSVGVFVGRLFAAAYYHPSGSLSYVFGGLGRDLTELSLRAPPSKVMAEFLKRNEMWRRMEGWLLLPRMHLWGVGSMHPPDATLISCQAYASVCA